MTSEKESKTPSPEKTSYKAPEGAETDGAIELGDKALEFQTIAKWIVLRKNDKPKAEMFYTAYLKRGETARPVTFVFNGGPGASSVYLHLGAMGPQRVDLGDKGLPGPAPHRLVDNKETWLAFTDLVFVDPVGTGLSRMIEEEKGKDEKNAPKAESEAQKQPSEYWRMKRDLESIGEFMRTWLSTHHRWESPVFIAGESYGGYRVGKLAKLLQKDYGIGLSGVVIISPALDFSLLDRSNYNVLPWVDIVPSMAAAALVHGKARKAKDGESPFEYAQRAADFALTDLLVALARGGSEHAVKRKQVFNILADFIGLPRAVVQKKGGRIDITYFVKNLLNDDGRHVGLYDASVSVTDPFPHEETLDAPDPTLHLLERVFASGINSQLRQRVGLETDREYELLSHEVNTSWKNDEQQHVLQSQFGAVDDLRYGMSLNEHMGVFLTHGFYDLVTPFTSSDRLASLMNLTENQHQRVTIQHYPGGHMFYTWAESREAMARDMATFYGKYAG